jgi:hypothetical protein
VRANLIVVSSPGFYGPSCIGQPEKPVLVQTLIPQAPDEALSKGILDWLPWRNEPKIDTTQVGPLVERLPGSFRSVVQDELLRRSTLTCHPLQYLDNAGAG